MKKLFAFLCIITMVLGVAGTAGAIPTAGTYGLNDGYWEGTLVNVGGNQIVSDISVYDPPSFSYFGGGIIDPLPVAGIGLSGTIWDPTDSNYYVAIVDAWDISIPDPDPSEMEIFGTISGTIDAATFVAALSLGDFSQTFAMIYSEMDSFTGPAFSITADVYLQGFTGDTIYGALDEVTLNVVPEPASMLLLGSGLIGLAGIRRKKKK